jgi:hypothetical protein
MQGLERIDFCDIGSYFDVTGQETDLVGKKFWNFSLQKVSQPLWRPGGHGIWISLVTQIGISFLFFSTTELYPWHLIF